MRKIIPYKRYKLESGYDLDNPLNLDAKGDEILMAKEIVKVLPGLKFKVMHKKTNTCVIFEEEISSAQEVILNKAVEDSRYSP